MTAPSTAYIVIRPPWYASCPASERRGPSAPVASANEPTSGRTCRCSARTLRGGRSRTPSRPRRSLGHRQREARRARLDALLLHGQIRGPVLPSARAAHEHGLPRETPPPAGASAVVLSPIRIPFIAKETCTSAPASGAPPLDVRRDGELAHRPSGRGPSSSVTSPPPVSGTAGPLAEIGGVRARRGWPDVHDLLDPHPVLPRRTSN